MKDITEATDSAPALSGQPRADAEVPKKRRRRRYTAEYKLSILEELDRAAAGEKGAILRREGLCSSHLSEWRKARRRGALGALDSKRGPRAKEVNPLDKTVVQLKRDNELLREELRKARLIIEAQGKVTGLLDCMLDSGRCS